MPVGVHPGKYEWAVGSGASDCSLRILAAEIEYDDGDWVCQVTASSFQNKDTLISEPARLVVRGKKKCRYSDDLDKSIVPEMKTLI